MVNWFLEKTSKIKKTLARFIREKNEKKHKLSIDRMREITLLQIQQLLQVK